MNRLSGKFFLATCLLCAASSPLTAAEPDKSIILPEQLADPIATVVVAEITGEPEVGDGAVGQAADGSLTLLAADADIIGGTARLVDQGGTPNIGFWMDAKDTVQWHKTGKPDLTATFFVFQGLERWNPVAP